MFEFIVFVVGLVVSAEREKKLKKEREKARRQVILDDAAKPVWQRPAGEQERIFSLQNLQRALTMQRA